MVKGIHGINGSGTLHMCQMVVTGERYIFYFGMFICGGTLKEGIYLNLPRSKLP